MKKPFSQWGFSTGEKRAILFICSAFLIGWVYSIYKSSNLPDAITLDSKDSLAVEAIRKAYYDNLSTADDIAGSARTKNVQRTPKFTTGQEQLLDINHATQTELQKLPGIGFIIAQRIVDMREKRGGFQSLEEILEVPGIGDIRFKRIRRLIVCSPLKR